MQTTDALRSTAVALLRRPSEVLPAYMAQSATQVVVQSVGMVGVLVAYLSLVGSGRIERFVTAFQEFQAALAEDGGPFGPGGDGELSAAAERAGAELADAAAALFTPTVLGVLAVTVALAFAVGIALNALLTGAKVHTARGAMISESPLVAAVEGARTDFVSYLGFALVQMLAFFAAPAVLFGGPAALAAAGVGPGGILTVVGLVLLALYVLVGLPVAYVLLLFVPEAIAVEDGGFLRGLRHNVGYLAEHPVRAAAFAVTDLGSRLFLVVLGIGLGVLGMGRLTGVMLLVGLAPFLGLFKMGVYVDAEPPFAGSPAYDREEFTSSLASGARTSVRELGRFAVGRFYAVGLALALFAVGGYAGWVGAESLGVTLPRSENDALFGAFGTIPIDDFFQIAANNWLVALAHSFAGLGFGFPTVTNLLFNGLVIGGLAGLTPMDLRVFAALIVPHGIVEIPALSVSGGLGLWLGWQSLAYLVGSDGAEELAESIRQAFYVLVGLLPAFVLASFVETVVSPQVGKVVRGLVGA